MRRSAPAVTGQVLDSQWRHRENTVPIAGLSSVRENANDVCAIRSSPAMHC